MVCITNAADFAQKNLLGLILKKKSENVTLVTLWLLTELVQ